MHSSQSITRLFDCEYNQAYNHQIPGAKINQNSNAAIFIKGIVLKILDFFCFHHIPILQGLTNRLVPKFSTNSIKKLAERIR